MRIPVIVVSIAVPSQRVKECVSIDTNRTQLYEMVQYAPHEAGKWVVQQIFYKDGRRSILIQARVESEIGSRSHSILIWIRRVIEHLNK